LGSLDCKSAQETREFSASKVKNSAAINTNVSFHQLDYFEKRNKQKTNGTTVE